ncbi:class I SAM-dependent methyltransferase [Chloroflexota bacterium]
MQNEHLISYTEITEKSFNEYVERYPELNEITCLIPRNDESIEEVLRENGFRYAGKRIVEGEVRLVYKWFRNLEKYEDMGAFFNRRADDYDLHMSDGNNFYETEFISLFRDIPVTDERLTILDLGCGTGAELKYIFEKAPYAHVVCIDVSEIMLDILRATYTGYIDNLDIMCESYLETDFGEEKYDFVVACSTLHHLLAEDKLVLFNKVKQTLKVNGYFLIQDYIALTEEDELSQREKYLELVNRGVIDGSRIYHIDLPLTLEHEVEILNKAGFTSIKTERMGENGVIITSRCIGSPAL